MSLVDAIPQTIKQIGAARAQGRAASGAYGQSVADIGQMASTIPAQVQAKKIQDQQMQIRDQQMQAGALELAQKKRADAADAALGSAFSTSLNPDGSINIPQLTQHLSNTPAASSIPKIVEQLNKMQESGISLQESTTKLGISKEDLQAKEADEMGALGNAASQPEDPNDQAGILLAGVASRVKKGLMTQEEANPIIAGLMGDDGNPDPEKVKGTIARLKAASKEQRTLADTDTRAKMQAESAGALADERKAKTESEKTKTSLINFSSQLSRTTSKEQYARVYAGIPDTLKGYFDAPEEWTPQSRIRANDAVLTPEQRETKRERDVTEVDKAAAAAETKRYHDATIAARNANTEMHANRPAGGGAGSNAGEIREYNEFTKNWNLRYPKPSPSAVDDDGNHLPAPPVPPSLDKWSVMTPQERNHVLADPKARIDDAEMNRRIDGGQPTQPTAPNPAGGTPDYGKRPDGTPKGNGFFGPLKLPNGVATEFSIADSEKLKDSKGNYIDYPALVPTLTKDEVQAVLKAAASNGKVELPDSVYDKAEAFALQRKKEGKPLFAQPGEQRSDLYPDIPRVSGGGGAASAAKPGAGKMIKADALKALAKQHGMSEEDARAQAIEQGYAIVK